MFEKSGMGTLRPALAATSAVYFWLPALAILIASRRFSVPGYSFDLVFLMLGLISSAGCIAALNTLRRISDRWYFGLPLACVVVAGTVYAALAFVAIPALVMPGDLYSLFLTGSGIVALLCIAPCTVLLSSLLSSFGEQHNPAIGTAIISGFVSLNSLVLLVDMPTSAAGFLSQKIFLLPLREGMMILYGIGTAILGVMLLIAALRFPAGQGT